MVNNTALQHRPPLWGTDFFKSLGYASRLKKIRARFAHVLASLALNPLPGFRRLNPGLAALDAKTQSPKIKGVRCAHALATLALVYVRYAHAGSPRTRFKIALRGPLVSTDTRVKLFSHHKA